MVTKIAEQFKCKPVEGKYYKIETFKIIWILSP